VRRLLGIRNVRLYVLGQVLSLFGDTSLWLAMGIWVKTLTGSNGAAGLVFFAFALPQLFAPLSGMLVDRVRRRPLLLVTNIVTGCIVLLLLMVHGADQVWLIYLVMVLYGAAYTVLTSAQAALLKTMVPDELLGEANTVLRTAQEGLRLVGPLTGAGLFAVFGGGAVAILDAATFAGAALSLILLRVEEARPQREEERWWAEVTGGIRHIARTRALRQVIVACGAAFLVIGFIESAGFAVVDQGLHRPPSFIGVFMVAQGVGAVVSAPIAAGMMRRTGEVPLIGMALAIFAAGSLLLVVSSLPVVLAGSLLLGFSLPWLVIGFNTLLQRRTPERLMGRVSSAADLLVGTPQTVSIAVGAALISLIDYRIMLLMIAAIVAFAAIYLTTRHEPPAAPALGSRLR
jgi:MFS family permease